MRPKAMKFFSVSDCVKKLHPAPKKIVCEAAHISIKCNHVEMRGKCSPEMLMRDGEWELADGS